MYGPGSALENTAAYNSIKKKLKPYPSEQTLGTNEKSIVEKPAHSLSAVVISPLKITFKLDENY